MASKNLLQLTALDQALDSDQFYVVRGGNDYRVSLGILLSLVNKALIGLENVDNTSDAEKPLSSAVATALSGKADKGEVVSLEAYELLLQQLQNYVTQAEINTAIDEIWQAINSRMSNAQIEAAINAAVEPFQTALTQIQTQLNELDLSGFVTIDQVNEAISNALQALAPISLALADHQSRIEALESTYLGFVTQSQLNQGLDTVRGEMALNFVTVNGHLEGIDQALQGIGQQLSELDTRFAAINHTHTAAEIDGLQEMVDEAVEQAPHPVSVGPNQW